MLSFECIEYVTDKRKIARVLIVVPNHETQQRRLTPFRVVDATAIRNKAVPKKKLIELRSLLGRVVPIHQVNKVQQRVHYRV